MSSERPEEFSKPPVSGNQPTSDTGRGSETGRNSEPSSDATRHEATVIVRGETVSDGATARDRGPKSTPTESSSKDKSSRKEVSEAKVKMQSRLPELDDNSDIGIQKEHIVVRDGKADIAFTGTMLASAAPASAADGQWQEYRVYETTGGKHVFSKVTRNVAAEQLDAHEAEVFDPSPSSVPSQLLRSARELARSRPLTWMDAAVAFFGYDPLAKALYRKLNGQFEEHIS
jgi:hypothetical protein